MRDGAAINFLIGSCPDATMDLVFAELAEGCTAIVKNDLALHTLNEVSNAVRQCIAKSWLSMQ
jgi:hypothetical protein